MAVHVYISEKYPNQWSRINIHFVLMFKQITNYCSIISRNTIVKNATSVHSIWQAKRMHLGFQSTGAYFLDFDRIYLEVGK